MKLNRNLTLMSIAIFFSVIGSFLLTIAFSVNVYSKTGSAFQASLLFLTQWLPNIFLAIFGGGISDRIKPSRLSPVLDCIAGVLTLSFLWVLDISSFGSLLILMCLRGFVTQMMISVRAVAIKAFFDPGETASMGSWVQTSYYVAFGLAGLIGASLIEHISLSALVWIDSITFFISAVLFYFTKELSHYQGESQKEIFIKNPFRDLSNAWMKTVAHKRIFESVGLVVLVAAFFQGSYTIIQTVLPIDVFHMGATGVSLYFGICSLGVISGTMVYQRLMKTKFFTLSDHHNNTRTRYIQVLVLLFMPVGLYIIVGYTKIFWINAIAYFFFALFFEVVWLKKQMQIIKESPQEHVGKIMGLKNGFGFALMAFINVITGKLLGVLQIGDTITLLMLFYVLGCLAVLFVSHMYVPMPKTVMCQNKS